MNSDQKQSLQNESKHHIQTHTIRRRKPTFEAAEMPKIDTLTPKKYFFGRNYVFVKGAPIDSFWKIV